jgi:hypothetical protein
MSNFSHLFQRHDLLYVYHTPHSTYTKFDPKIYLSTRRHTSNYAYVELPASALRSQYCTVYRLPSSQHDTKIPTNADIRIYFPCSNHSDFVCYTYTLYTPRTCTIVFILSFFTNSWRDIPLIERHVYSYNRGPIDEQKSPFYVTIAG